MDNTKQQDLFKRILSIDLNQYLQKAGFKGIPVQPNLTAYSIQKHHDVIVVDSSDNTWVSVQKKDSYENIFALAAWLDGDTVPEFLDRMKNHPSLPEESTIDPYRKMVYLPELHSERLPIFSEEAEAYFQSLKLPLDFVNQHCAELEVSIQNDPQQYTGILLHSQQRADQLMMFSQDQLDGVPQDMFTVKEISFRPGHAYTDRGTRQLEVFTSISDLLVRHYQLKQAGTPVPSQLLLSGPFSFEGARTLMEQHSAVHLFLPNSTINDEIKGYARWLSPKYKDFSGTYRHAESLASHHTAELISGKNQENKRGLGR